MNKRTLLIGGGLFSALLASLAVYQTYNDTSTFSSSNKESLAVLQAEKATVFQAEILQAAGSTSTASKINIDRLQQATTQLYADMIPPANLRLTAFASTDRVVYRAEDYLLLEIFFFDSLLKTPYIPPATNIPTVDIRLNLKDSAGNAVGTEKTIAGSLAPTIGVSLKLTTFIAVASLTPDTYTLVISDGAQRQFPETSVTFQIRDYVPEPANLNSNAGASIQIFGDYAIKTGLATDNVDVFGKIVAGVLTCGVPPTPRTLTITQLQTSSAPAATPITVTGLYNFAPDGQLYFAFQVPESFILNSRDMTILVTVNSDSAACGDQLSTYITFGDDREPVPFLINEMMMDFVTQDNGDLVPNTTQTIYYHIYFERNGVVTGIPFTDATIFSYKLDTPWVEPVVLAKNVQADASGFGSSTFRIPFNTQLFIEIYLDQFSETPADDIGLKNPWFSTLNMGEGYFRIPINPDSITGFRKQILLRKLGLISTPLLVSEINNIDLSVVDATLDLRYHFKEGLFYIEDNSQADTPVIAKFNSFPNPLNFTNNVLFTYALQYPNPADIANIRVTLNSFDLSEVIIAMARKLAVDLNTQLGAASPTNLQNAVAGAGDDDLILMFMHTTYKPVDQLVYAEITYYNADGPVVNYIEGDNGHSYVGDPEYVPSSFEQPAITMTINDNILSTQQDLVVNFQTNSLMDPTKAYLLTVKQKEQVLYSEAFSFSQNTNQKRTIPFGKINKLNGGVFSVDLYKISDLYVSYESAFSTTSGGYMCPLNLLANPTSFAWATYPTDRARVEVLDDILTQDQLDTTDEIRTNAFFNPSSTSATNPVRVAFKNCIVDSPELLNNFITRVGSAQFYRRPQPAVNVQVSTNKAQYTKGETVSVTVTLTNMTDNTVGITSGAYLSLMVVEDLDFPDIELQSETLGERIYISDQIDEYQTDISDIINKQYDPSLSSISDSPLRNLMAHQIAFNRLYEPSTLLNNPYFTADEIELFGLDYFNLCDKYGYRFTKYSTPFAEDTAVLAFKQTYLLNYLNQGVASGNRDYSNDILGYKRSYPTNIYQSAAPADAAKDLFGTWAQTGPRRVTSTFRQQITDTSYDRNADTYLREVLYFQSGVALTAQTTTYTFQTGDLISNFKVKAVVVHANGVGFDETTFTTAEPFQVELDYPSVMVEGEMYTLSATVVNMSPQNINVTVSRDVTENNDPTSAANKLFVNFTGSFTDSNTTLGVTTRYIVVSAGSAGTISFKISATQIGEALATLNFKASSLRIISASSSFTTTYTDDKPLKITVVKPYPRRLQYSSGFIQTLIGGAGNDYGALASDSAVFKINIPVSTTEDDILGLTGDLFIMSSRLGMLSILLEDFEAITPSEYGNFFSSGLEVASYIDLVQMKYLAITEIGDEQTSASPDPTSNAQTYFYDDRLFDFVSKIISLIEYLDATYAVKNSTGHCLGYDYFENDYQRGGSLALTAYILNINQEALQQYYLNTQIDYFFNPESCYSTSLDWILSKQTLRWVPPGVGETEGEYEIAGNYTMDPLDVDAQGRAPWNITQAYVTYQLSQIKIEVPDGSGSSTNKIPDLAAQIYFLIQQVTDSFTPVSVFDIDLDSDPYYIALGLETMNSYFGNILLGDSDTQSLTATQVQEIQDWYASDADGATVWAAQLRLHQFTQTNFPLNYNNSFDNFRPFFSYTPFNTYKLDRVIETTAMVCHALLNYGRLSGSYDPTTSDAVIESATLGINFLRSNNRRGMMGSMPSTLEAIRTVFYFEEYNYFYFDTRTSTFPPVEEQTITFTIERDYPVPGPADSIDVSYTQDYLIPREFQVLSDATEFPGWLAGEYEITITMSTDLAGSPTQEQSTFVTYSFETGIYDYEFLGELDAKGSNIYLEVFSNNDLNEKDVGEYVEYQVTLMNYDRGRSHNGVEFIIRPSPCLAIDTEYLDEGIAAGDYINYLVDPSEHAIHIYGRGVGPFGYPTFTLAFEKQFGDPDTDHCIERYFSAQLSGFASSLVHAYPTDASPDPVVADP